MEDLGDMFLGVEEDNTPQGELFPPDEKEKKEVIQGLRSLALGNTFLLINAFTSLKEEILSIYDISTEEIREKYNPSTLGEVLSVLSDVRQRVIDIASYEDESLFLDYLKRISKLNEALINEYNEIEEVRDSYFSVETDPVTKKPTYLPLKTIPPDLDPFKKLREIIKTYRPLHSQGTPLKVLKDIANSPKPGQIRISKDLMETQTYTAGDTLEYIKDPKKREKIRKLQAEGKLLAGTLEGLSGGTPYLKSFTIALAQTLNEQSKYYKTEGDYSGVPGKLIPDIFGEDVEIQKEASVPVKYREGNKIEIKQEKRKHPYILVSYEDLASKMRGIGKKRGGKDSETIRNYIEDLSGKQYLLDGGTDTKGKQILIGVPFLVRELFIYRDGKEVGCLLRLNPQFSKTLRGYTGLRANTIQMIGGGKQKPITMSLLDLLLYVRGTDKKDYIWKKNKGELLSQIVTSTRYKTHPKDLDRDFKEAIEKVKICGLITDYKEEITPGGETLSVFVFNPYYSKREEETPDLQTEK
jgi:hypothetical protein